MQNISRMIVGIVAVPIVVAMIFFLPVGFFVTFIMAVTVVGLYEYFSLVPEGFQPVSKLCFVCMGGLFPLVSYFGSLPWTFGWLFAILAVMMIFAMRTLEQYEDVLSLVGGNYLGFLFVALPLSITIPIITSKPWGPGWILWLVLVMWAGDTGAFYLGTRFGRHKLYPKVSPKKSVEGVAGGMLSSMLMGMVASRVIHTGFSAFEAMILPLVLLLLGQLGDFSESMLKRGAGVKDSGRILAGHGGVLDRIDSFLFSIPFFYLYLLLRP